MKPLVFALGLLVAAFGAVIILEPSGLFWIARHCATSGALYVIAAIRVAFGLVLISVAPASRTPKTLRGLGYFVFIAGIATALASLLAIERVQAIVEWWLQQGSVGARLSGVFVMIAGSFIAYACAPARRAT